VPGGIRALTVPMARRGGRKGQDVGGSEELTARLRRAPMAGGRSPDFVPERAGGAPGPLFAAWLSQALADGVPEPQVVTVSTVDAGGRPSARVVILRGLECEGEQCGFRFAGDAGSRKGTDLAARPYAALTWYWPAYGRQIRAAGPVQTLDATAAREDFLGRSEAARVAGLTGRMSEPLSGPQEYETERARARARAAADPDAVPERHTVYLLRAEEIEFFQLAADRFHRRLRYRRTESGWQREQLWP
jgi:pyridoxamine 5'-phosphate oxidase